MLATNADLRTRIAGNLNAIRGRIAEACARAGRDPAQVHVVGVTKAVGLDEVAVLLELGVDHLGENRVEVAEEKIRATGPKACWHMIGSIQRRKARRIVELFDRVDSVDRMKLAETLNDFAGEAGKILPVLVQVNVAGETQKHGFSPDEARDAVARIDAMEHLSVRGLMCMAPIAENAEAARPVFRSLAELARELELETLSMGMTGDFEVAVEEGATEVRIGTALYQ